VGFNRWSPYNYGVHNTKGWRLSEYDPDDYRIFLGMRSPANKQDWLECIDYASKLWIADRKYLEQWMDRLPEDTYKYQTIIYVSGFFVAFKKYSTTEAYASRELIESLLDEFTPDSIFEEDLNVWSSRRNISITDSYGKSQSATSHASRSKNEFQCSKCFLISHQSRQSNTGETYPICSDCA